MSERSWDDKLGDDIGWFILGWLIRIVVAAFLIATIMKVWL